jgi:hypothetical protein
MSSSLDYGALLSKPLSVPLPASRGEEAKALSFYISRFALDQSGLRAIRSISTRA